VYPIYTYTTTEYGIRTSGSKIEVLVTESHNRTTSKPGLGPKGNPPVEIDHPCFVITMYN